VRVADDVDELLGSHYQLTGARRDDRPALPGCHVVHESHTDRQTSLVVRCSVPVDDPEWTVESLGLEDLVLAYLSTSRAATPAAPLVAEGRR
jgi:ABC-2 type transport system ATP-binding protein